MLHLKSLVHNVDLPTALHAKQFKWAYEEVVRDRAASVKDYLNFLTRNTG